MQTEKDSSNDTIENISVQSDSINGNKSLKINNSERNPFIVVKHFDIPGNFPFDTSDRLFEIRYNEDMEAQNSQESVISRHESKSFNNNLPPSTSTLTSTLALENKNTHGPNTGGSFGSSNSNSRFGYIQSTSTVDTYYIYSFEGKLMAEYDHDGNCVKDYIYAGNRLIAEYQPQANKYYYYMSDQINSTRIVTDDNGNVVYSESYGPFGGVQKNWTKVYDPKLKFSSKEREAYGDLDYFGGRYFDHNSYRFISVDPIINKGEALYNPQLWNLYSYCRNNPITFMDTDGRRETIGDSYHQARDRILSQYGPQAAAEFEAGYMTGMKISIAAAAALAIKYIGPEIAAAIFGKSDDSPDDNNDYPENPDDLELKDGWHETDAKDKTGGRHRIWKGPNDEVIRWDKEGRRGSQKDRGAHYHDSIFPGEHIKPGTKKKDLEKKHGG